jgi:hypothetical protein
MIVRPGMCRSQKTSRGREEGWKGKREEKEWSIFVKSFKVVDAAESSAHRIVKRW